jgi:DNA-binding CsgD family transcriptional regulator
MLTLSSADLSRLEATLQELLSPLAYADVSTWRTSVSRRVKELFRADKAACILNMEGQDFLIGEDIDVAGFRAYEEYFWKLDVGYQQQRRALGLEVNNLAMVYDLASLGETEVYNDFSRRYGFLDALAASTDLDGASAPGGVVVYHERESSPEFGERGVALMRLLLPALKTGITTCVRFANRRAHLTQFLDTLPGGCLAVDRANVVIHQTAGVDTMLASDPERERVSSEMRRCAAVLTGALRERSVHERIAGTLHGSRQVRTGHATYQLRAGYLGAGPGDPDTLVLVTVERASAVSLADADLAQRFGLTPREIQVARQLEVGRTNREIASLLGVTLHTAERHAERVLTKLDVHSRAAVPAMLRVV